MQIDFRAATALDEKILVELRREFCQFEPFPNPLDAESNQIVLRRLIENEQFGKIWLISLAGEIVGYLVLTFAYSLEYAGRDAILDELYLRKNARGRGIGAQAIGFVTNLCRAENIRAIHLEVEQENTAAQNLYYQTGFANYNRLFLTKWIETE